MTTGAEAATEIEIIILEGDINDFETDNWTADECDSKNASYWNGTKVLQVNNSLILKVGTRIKEAKNKIISCYGHAQSQVE